MIKNSESRWKSGSMTEKESFDTFYRKKLDMFAAQLRDVAFDAVYVVGKEYACLVCHCRVFHRGQQTTLGRCVLCFPVWLRTRSESRRDAILSHYPQMEECAKEWEASGHKNPAQHPPLLPRTKQGDGELGRQIKEARLKLGMSTHELAAKITKVKGGRLTERSIRGYESGSSQPSQNVMEQLKSILGLEV